MESSSIRTKLVLEFLAVALIPLILSAVLNLGMAYSALSDNRNQALMGAAVQTAEQIDSFIIDSLDTVRTQAMLPDIIDYLEASPVLRRGSVMEERVLRVLDSFRRRDPANISSYALFDAEGDRVLDTHAHTGKESFRKEWFDEPMRTGLPHASSVMMSGQTGEACLFFSSPVKGRTGKNIGVIRARFKATAVQDPIHQKEGMMGPGSVALLLDEEAVRIADSRDRTMIFKPLLVLSREKRLRLSAGERLCLPVRENETLPDFHERLLLTGTTPFFTTSLYPSKGEPMSCAAVSLKTRPWKVVVAQSRSVLMDTIISQLFFSALLFVAIAAAAMAAAIVIAKKIARPIMELNSVAGRIAGGDLDQKVDKISDDEIGTLGDTFNAMSLALKESRENLRSYAEKLEIIHDTTPDARFVHSAEGKIMEANKACTDLYGYSREELLSLNVGVLSGHGHTRDIAESRMARAMETGSDEFEWLARKKDGAEFPVYVRLRRLPKAAGDAIIAVVSDMTMRKKLENQLIHAQKMEAIGTLAGGIAHDFNNLLMGIQGYASLIKIKTDPGSPAFERLNRIEELVKSGARLAGQLLGFARGGKYEVKTVSLNEVVRSTLSTFGRTSKEVVIMSSLSEELLPVDADRNQLEQVCMNLFVNASQAMPGGGQLHVETSNVTLDEAYTAPHGLKPGRFARMSVTDSGTGMDEDTRTRVFDPFFTTRDKNRGTGLGLASVYGIVKNHGGIITVYSEIGHGTSFHIYLPATQKEHAKEPEIIQDILPGKETVLLIDDEDVILNVGREILESLGYRVYTASSGKDAISLYQEKCRDIDLVILDMIMPVMGGRETFAALKAINPLIRAILSSGYSMTDKAKEIMDMGCLAFIQKPFSMVDISQKIRTVLDLEVI